MRYRNIIITLGFIILVLSTGIIGVPPMWSDIALRLAAFAIVVLAYLAGNERKAKAPEASASAPVPPTDAAI